VVKWSVGYMEVRTVTASLIQEGLKGILCRADENHLMKIAECNDASQSVTTVFTKLRNPSFPSPMKVNKAIGDIEQAVQRENLHTVNQQNTKT